MQICHHKAVVILFDITASCTDTLSQTLWLELTDDPEFSAQHLFPSWKKNAHKMSFAGEDHQNSSPSLWEEFTSSLCPASPAKHEMW